MHENTAIAIMHTGAIVSLESNGSSVRISADFLISLCFAK
jgi:hypothetical protein